MMLSPKKVSEGTLLSEKEEYLERKLKIDEKRRNLLVTPSNSILDIRSENTLLKRSGTANFFRPTEPHMKSPIKAYRTSSKTRLQFHSKADMRAYDSALRSQFSERFFDIVVIGGGFAGLSCACAASRAKEDLSVLLVSRGPIGGSADKWRRDYPKNVKSRQDLEKAVEDWQSWRGKELIKLLEAAPRLCLVEGAASLNSIDEVDVECANGDFFVTRPDRIVLATGSTDDSLGPLITPASQLPQRLLGLKEGRVCVIGFDTQAVESVGLCVRAGFGKNTVWILHESTNILPNWEPELSNEILSCHADAGVMIISDFGDAVVKSTDVAHLDLHDFSASSPAGTLVVEGTDRVETGFDVVVKSTPAKCFLPQGALSIVVTDAQSGHVLVDDSFETSCKGKIFAVGACAKKKQERRSNASGPDPIQQGTRLGNSLFSDASRHPSSDLGFFSVVWSCPPAGVVGLSEQEAKSLAEFGKLQVDVRRYGDTLVKLISLFNEEWRVVGVGLVGNVDWLPGMAIALLSGSPLGAFEEILDTLYLS